MEGYGRSSKPPGSSTHIEYSKRELANDLVQLMSHFKFEKFNILAHDRGARVAHRLALDHPSSVQKVVLLDIAPTLWMYEQTDMAFVRPLSFPSIFLNTGINPLSQSSHLTSLPQGLLMRLRLVIPPSLTMPITSP